MATTKPRRKRPSISDAELVALMDRGIIELRDIFTEPQLYTFGKLRKAELNEQGGKRRIHGSSRWRFTIQHEGRKRNVMRSRLVWLWAVGIIAPDHLIHHKDEDRYFDAFQNLESIHTDAHNALHYGESNDADF